MIEKRTKSVGILSMQRIINNGSFLQAYGLKKIIESLGNEVVFLDYKIEKPLIATKQERKRYKQLKCRNNILNIIYKFRFMRRCFPDELKYYVDGRAQYEKSLKKYLGVKGKKNIRKEVDTLVIGSDEVFNCFQLNPYVGYSRELFGFNAHANKKITYGASFGNATLEKIVRKGKEEEISQMLQEFNAISVRDNNSYGIVKSLISNEKEVAMHLDPVLMYDFTKENIEDVSERNYIVVYAYRKRLTQDEINVITDFAKRRNKKIISIGGYHAFSDIKFQGNPFKVLSYFKNADYVFTDTFHGTIFSIIFHKRFITFIRNSQNLEYGNNEKLSDLLEKLQLTERCVTDYSLIDMVMDMDMPYEQVDKIIKEERESTVNYLLKNI